jgi:hypothetical protein
VISDERLSHNSGIKRELKASRLRKVIGPASILLIIRRQEDALESLYFHELSTSSPGSAPSFQEWIEHHLKDDRTGVIEMFDYAQVIDLYGTEFAENIYLIPLELMQLDPFGFTERLCTILGVRYEPSSVPTTPTNARTTSRAALYERVRKILPAGAFRRIPLGARSAFGKFLSQGRPIEASLSESSRERVRSYYAPGNNQISSRFRLPLSELGYTELPLSHASRQPTRPQR